ncbi:hypothetical protein RHS04_07590 [Rhizoctonia solani]|uniref:T6SS Phospholipase effector Tle1-like catalytic domain-containing protein n=1 Tax=Rhizoctonia solani TaxID=456999 RepID=A0A8H7H3N3_9AGAM|nr:hypothetical protein RHS04_07590 [Rhizoctonia solani]
MDADKEWTELPNEMGQESPKYIMVFCDGTGKDGESLSQEDKFVEQLPERVEVEGVTFGRIAHYIPGVGSRLQGTAGLLAKLHGMATVHTVVTAYLYIAAYYRPGDRICLFGYSRGAFAARKVASLIFHCGLSVGRDQLLKQWARREKPVCWIENQDGFKLEGKGQQSIPIKYLCVWDTVCAVRDLPHVAPVKEMLGIREEELTPNVEHALHALAFHENRKPFGVTLFEENATTHLEEVWFPGSHSDVGGGGELSHLPKISLEWMMVGRFADVHNVYITHIVPQRHLDIFNSAPVAEMVKLDYSITHSFNPHNASRQGKLAMMIREEDRIKSHRLGKRSQIHQSMHYLETILFKDIDKHLLNLNQLSERTGWNRLGYTIYCPLVDELMGTGVSFTYLESEFGN